MRRVGMLLCGFMFVGGMVLLVLLAQGLFGPLGWGWSSGGYGWGLGPWVWGGFGFPFIGLAMLVFCVLMMGGMMMHGRPHALGGGSAWMSMPPESLSEILQRRYTRGEITKAQYEEMRETLGVSDATVANVHAHR